MFNAVYKMYGRFLQRQKYCKHFLKLGTQTPRRCHFLVQYGTYPNAIIIESSMANLGNICRLDTTLFKYTYNFIHE